MRETWTDWQFKTSVAFLVFNRPDTTAQVFAEIARARPPVLLVVVVLGHHGAGLALWDMGNYQLHTREGRVYAGSDELIFYHFHALQIADRHLLSWHPFLGSRVYRFTQQRFALIYRLYVRRFRISIGRVQRTDPDFAWGYTAMRWRGMLRALCKGNLILAWAVSRRTQRWARC